MAANLYSAGGYRFGQGMPQGGLGDFLSQLSQYAQQQPQRADLKNLPPGFLTGGGGSWTPAPGGGGGQPQVGLPQVRTMAAAANPGMLQQLLQPQPDAAQMFQAQYGRPPTNMQELQMAMAGNPLTRAFR